MVGACKHEIREWGIKHKKLCDTMNTQGTDHWFMDKKKAEIERWGYVLKCNLGYSNDK